MERLNVDLSDTDSGLNLLPKIAALNNYASQMQARRSRASFYGNYEGDNSMFPPSPEQLSEAGSDFECFEEYDDIIGNRDNESPRELETDSDIEKQDTGNEKSYSDEERIDDDDDFEFDNDLEDLDRELSETQLVVPAVGPVESDMLADKMFDHKPLQQVATFTEILSNQMFCKRFIVSVQVAYATLAWAALFLIRKVLSKTKFNSLCHFMLCIRNLIRQLLWWMTLSKSGDILHFARMVVASPVVFTLGLIGLITAIFKSLKFLSKQTVYFMTEAVIWVKAINNEVSR